MNMLKNKKGVTLVELLAVVVILGIIAAIAVPTIGGLIERQRENAAEATYVQMEEAARLFAVDDADGVFTLEALVADSLDLKANVLATGVDAADTTLTTIIVGDYDLVQITVAGSSVTITDLPTTDTFLFINGYHVATEA
jgi:type IV pilus assembly protein PilA